jgi:hypothetical protein
MDQKDDPETREVIRVLLLILIVDNELKMIRLWCINWTRIIGRNGPKTSLL